jgi:hypothetical protein
MSPGVRSVCVLLLLCVAGGCAQPSLKDRPSAEFGSAELYPVKSSGFAEAYVRRDANLPSYRTVDILPLDVDEVDIPSTMIAGTQRRDWLMTPERQAGLRAMWAEAMNRVFKAYDRGTAGSGVLRIAARLTRIAPGRPTATTIGAELQPMPSSQDVVEIWAEFRLYNGVDGSLLGVIRDNRTITSMAMSRTAPVAMTSLFNSWAALLHTRVSGR